MNPEGISVVVPVFNSSGTLAELVERTAATLSRLEIPFEMILIDDGSHDGSWDAIRREASEHHWLVPVRLTRNFGQHNALLCGIRKARFDSIVTIDDDLQHLPESIPDLVKELANHDVVYGTPVVQQHGFFRSLASKATRYALGKTMGTDAARHISAFRAFRTWLRDAFADYQSPFVSVDVLLSWSTVRFGAIPIDHQPRRQGRSNYNLRRLLSHAINMVTGFSVLPLQIASFTGLTAMLLGVGLLLFLLIRWLVFGSTVPGFTFLASAITLFAGVQLFALGLMGEYIARIHVRSMGRPTYVEDTPSGG